MSGICRGFGRYEISALRGLQSREYRAATLRVIADEEYRAQYPSGITPAIHAMKARLRLPKGISVDAIGECLAVDARVNRPRIDRGMAAIRNVCEKSLKERYPKLSLGLLSEAVEQFTSQEYLEQISRIFGFQHLSGSASNKGRIPEMLKSFLGLLGDEMGDEYVTQFIQDYVIRKELNWAKLISSIPDKQGELDRLFGDRGDSVVARMLAESGRKSSEPIFSVGVFCGVEKLGEGAAKSIRAAQEEARGDALFKFYYSSIQ